MDYEALHKLAWWVNRKAIETDLLEKCIYWRDMQGISQPLIDHMCKLCDFFDNDIKTANKKIQEFKKRSEEIIGLL